MKNWNKSLGIEASFEFESAWFKVKHQKESEDGDGDGDECEKETDILLNSNLMWYE